MRYTFISEIGYSTWSQAWNNAWRFTCSWVWNNPRGFRTGWRVLPSQYYYQYTPSPGTVAHLGLGLGNSLHPTVPLQHGSSVVSVHVHQGAVEGEHSGVRLTAPLRHEALEGLRALQLEVVDGHLGEAEPPRQLAPVVSAFRVQAKRQLVDDVTGQVADQHFAFKVEKNEWAKDSGELRNKEWHSASYWTS